MKIRIEWHNKKTCTITLIPGWLGRLFGAETRRGIAYRGTYWVSVFDDDDNETEIEHIGFYWETTRRYVGWRVMRAIEAAPVQSIEDMSVEQLLLEEPQRRRP